MRLRGRSLRSGEPIEITVRDRLIASISPLPTSAHIPADVWLLPGLFDIQVNGYGGHNFHKPADGIETVRAGVRALWREGVTHCCPTITTNDFEVIMHAFRTLAAACADPLMAEAMPCFHLEGPYISSEDGPRGAHPRQHVRPPDWDEFRRWQEAAEGRIRLVTLAPELPGALAFIENLVREEMVVALGHTAASPAQIRDAITAGARLSTHLGNGAHAQIPRHPNYIWEQAAADDLYASLILDGHHLPPSVAKSLIRCKGIDHTILISDAVAPAGLGPGRYRVLDKEVEVSSDLRCSLVGTPYLAGSVISLRFGISNAVRFAQVTPLQAVQMATENPRRLFDGERDGRPLLRVGSDASIVLCRWQPWMGEPEVLATVVAGRCVYRSEREEDAAVLTTLILEAEPVSSDSNS